MENFTNNANLTSLLIHYYNSTTSGDAQLYAMFRNSGPTPVLILPALVLSLIAIVGIPLNAGIVYTTFRHRKTLNRNANYLIAINAFFDMLQLSHPFPFLFISLSGTNFIGTFQSFRLIIPSLFGIQCSLTCIACTAVDRLLSVLLPIHYHKMSKGERHLYCWLHIMLCVANGVWNVVGLWIKCAAEADKPVTGFIAQIGWDSTKDFVHYLVGPVLIWMTIGCYFAIGSVLLIQKIIPKIVEDRKRKAKIVVVVVKQQKQQEEIGPKTCSKMTKSKGRVGWNHSQQQGGNGLAQQQKLLKSLTLIVSVHVGTSLFGSLLLGFSPLWSTITTWYMSVLSLCIILLGSCSNAVVLYWNSAEYRQLFRNGLGEIRSAGRRAMGATRTHAAAGAPASAMMVGINMRSSPPRSASASNRTTNF